MHTHDDAALVEQPGMVFKISQGCTTVVTGNCGISPAPFDAARGVNSLSRMVFRSEQVLHRRMAGFMAQVEATRPAVNAACLIGHTTLRNWAMGDDLDRPATEAVIADKRARVAEAMEGGAGGLSSGLVYPPARAPT